MVDDIIVDCRLWMTRCTGWCQNYDMRWQHDDKYPHQSPANVSRIKPKVLQNRFYSDSGYDRELRAFCLEKGIRYQTFWTLTANPHLLDTWRKRLWIGKGFSSFYHNFYDLCRSLNFLLRLCSPNSGVLPSPRGDATNPRLRAAPAGHAAAGLVRVAHPFGAPALDRDEDAWRRGWNGAGSPAGRFWIFFNHV